jgi:hypothetical protein
MKPREPIDAGSLRDFRWRLQAVERKHAMALDRASLALGVAQRETPSLQRRVDECALRQAEQERWARECAIRDPHLQGQALRWLLSCAAQSAAARAARDAQRRHLQALQAQCLDRQRQLDAVQALREEAQRVHAQAQFRRASREADAAWLARRATVLEDRA